MTKELDESKWVIAGDMRPSQIITTHGPGSIITMKNDAVMIYGCNHWPPDDIATMKKGITKKRYKILHHELLQKRLGKFFGTTINSFKMPLSQDRSINVPCTSFPRWGVCKNCGRLQKHEPAPKDNKGFFCWSCEKNKIKPKDCELSHSRFVVACENGHIDEFPWEEWVHRNNKPEMKCKDNPGNPQLTFGSKQKSSALKDYFVRCSCGEFAGLGGASEAKNFNEMKLECTGREPWIFLNPENTESPPCLDEHGNPTIVRGMQVRSNSIWYAINMSALKVPKWLHPVNIRLEDEKDQSRLYGSIQADREENKSFEAIYEYHKEKFKEAANQIIEQRKKEKKNCSEEDIKNEIIEKLEEIFDDNAVDDSIPGQIEILNQEFDDFNRISDTTGKNYENEFQLETSQIDKNISVFRYLDSLKKIQRITQINVLFGFTRGVIPDLLDPDQKSISKITSMKHLRTDKWLPAVKSRGEGIFISLNNELLSEWEKDTELQKRSKLIIDSYAEYRSAFDEKKKKEIKARFNPRFILLHTLSHFIIKALVEEAGYDEPSLNERIYWDGENRNGILIVASGSSEGSLGGLVRLADPVLFKKILLNAIQKSRTCSRDPVCEDTDLQESDMHQVNGSACHSCCFVAETTCAYFNQFLDRHLIIDEDMGFFSDLIK